MNPILMDVIVKDRQNEFVSSLPRIEVPSSSVIRTARRVLDLQVTVNIQGDDDTLDRPTLAETNLLRVK